MKRSVKFISIIIFCFCTLGILSSCMTEWDFQRLPEESPGSTYYCKEYDIKFFVHDERFSIVEGIGITDYCSSITGEMTVDGIKYEFYANSYVTYDMAFYSKDIENEGTHDRYSNIPYKYLLVSMKCDYKRGGVIETTVDGGTIFEEGTVLTFIKEK